MLEPMNDAEIRVKFQSIEDTLENQDNSLKRIENMGKDTNLKVGYTNGKVAEIIKWKERATGAGWAFGICCTLVILPIAGWALYNQVQEPHLIQAAISDYMRLNYSDIRIENGN